MPQLNGIAIRRARLSKGMTLRDVSAECDRRGCKIDASNLSRAEQGLPGGIGARKVPVLAAVLGLTMDDLIPDEDAALAVKKAAPADATGEGPQRTRKAKFNRKDTR